MIARMHEGLSLALEFSVSCVKKTITKKVEIMRGIVNKTPVNVYHQAISSFKS